jgi:hypothetical protein
MTSLPSIEPPQWRVIDPNGAFVSGQMRQRGDVLVHEGWPPNGRGLEPANDSAKRVQKYWLLHHAQPGFPKSPRHPEHGLFLPAILPKFGQSIAGPYIIGLLPPHEVDRGLLSPPEYRMAGDMRVGQTDLNRGDRCYFLGWPSSMFEPENHPAEQVSAYFARNHEHPKLLTGPWCHLRGLFLPVLPELPRHDGKPLPLDTVKYADAIAGELATVRPPNPITGVPETTRSGTSSGVNRLAESALITRERK